MGAYLPLDFNFSSHAATPMFSLISVIVFILAALLLLRLLGGKYQTRSFGTWDCGFQALNSRMQYNGTAFSKPIKIVFKIFFKSSRNLKMNSGDPYHPNGMEYTITTESLFEKYIYIPLLVWVTGWSKKLKFMIQTGSIHAYLLYIFLAVLMLMLYNRIG